MKCEMNYCVYNKEYSCILEKIQLNSLGMCEECMLISISAELLEDLKETQLQDIESRWKK